MKTFFSMVIVAAVATATAIAQVDTAENVVNSTVQGTEKAARTFAHGVKKAADTVEDAFTPDSDARRVDVTMTDDRIDMPAQLKPACRLKMRARPRRTSKSKGKVWTG